MHPFSIRYTSKRTTGSYTIAQNLMDDFNNAPMPFEHSGYCTKLVSQYVNSKNSDANVCGRHRVQNNNVGFKLAFYVLEMHPGVTSYEFKIVFRYGQGSGGVVVVDSVIVQDLIGVASGVSTEWTVLMESGYRLVEIYGASTVDAQHFKFEYKRASGSWRILDCEQLRSSAFDQYELFPLSDAALAYGAAFTPSVTQYIRNAQRMVLFPTPMRSDTTIQTNSTHNNPPSRNTAVTYDITHVPYQITSAAFLPGNAFQHAKTTSHLHSVADYTSWTKISEMDLSMDFSGAGTLLISIVAYAATTQSNNAGGAIEMFVAINNEAVSAPHIVFSSEYLDQSLVPASFAVPKWVATGNTENTISLYVRNNGITASSGGGNGQIHLLEPQLSAVFLQGAQTSFHTIADTAITGDADLFSQAFSTYAATYVVIVRGTLCRTSPTQDINFKFTIHDVRLQGLYGALANSNLDNTCEPIFMFSTHTMFHTAVTVKWSVETTGPGYSISDVTLEVLQSPGAALMTKQECMDECATFFNCHIAAHDETNDLCWLMNQREYALSATTYTVYSYYRETDLNPAENIWTVLEDKYWTGTTGLLLTFGNPACPQVDKSEQCQCLCRIHNDCMGFNYNMNDETCMRLNIDDMRPSNSINTSASTGIEKVHINAPSSCHQIKQHNHYAESGWYTLFTTSKMPLAYCDMSTDNKLGYTYVICNDHTSGANCNFTKSESDLNDCSSYGLQVVVPRSMNHFLKMHEMFGTFYHHAVPGIYCNSCLVTEGIVTHPMRSGFKKSKWKAVDDGSWFISDTVNTNFPSGNAADNAWLGMHEHNVAQWVPDGIDFRDNNKHFEMRQYICSTNDVDEFRIWSLVSETSIQATSSEPTWTVSWSGTKFWSPCPGVTFLGGYNLAGSGAIISKVIVDLPAGKIYGIRVRLNLYFVGDWSNDADEVIIEISGQTVWRAGIFDIQTSCCSGCPEFSGKEVVVVRYGLSGTTQEINVTSTITQAPHVQSFAIDNIQIDREVAFKSSYGNLETNPASSCDALQTERNSTGQEHPVGLYWLKPSYDNPAFQGVCSKGYLVAQRRGGTRTVLNFNRPWTDYMNGFMDYWSYEWYIGNEILHLYTENTTVIKVELVKDGNITNANYAWFEVYYGYDYYVFYIEDYIAAKSSATNKLEALRYEAFSTPDEDNDEENGLNCAATSGFWFENCGTPPTNLNGPWTVSSSCDSYPTATKALCDVTGGITWSGSDFYHRSSIMVNAKPCLIGQRMDANGDCTDCEAGSYGTGLRCVACSSGTYSDVEGATTCIDCPSGTMSHYYQSYCTDIEAGYYCTKSTRCSWYDVLSCGGFYVFCTGGAAQPTAVSTGYYSVNELGEPYNGDSYNGENQVSQLLCAIGSYCDKGHSYLCPATRYGDVTGLSSAMCSGQCDPGCHCPSGSTTSCPGVTSGVHEINVRPTHLHHSISYLSSEPLDSTGLELQTDITNSNPANGYVEAELFDIFEHDLYSLNPSWGSGFGHTLSISFFQRWHHSVLYEFTLSSAAFDWGMIVLLDDILIVARNEDATKVFQFSATFG